MPPLLRLGLGPGKERANDLFEVCSFPCGQGVDVGFSAMPFPSLRSTSLALSSLLALSSPSLLAEVVAVIDEGGDVDVSIELGSFGLEEMRSLITATNDLEIAGVLNAEGTFAAGNFSRETAALAQKVTGASRYGREDGVATKASGSRWAFVNGSETWTPDPGLSYFGLITTPLSTANFLAVTVTYSDASTDTVTVSEPGVTAWIGFHEPGKTITSIEVSDPPGGAFGNYDDLSLAFVETAPPPAPVVELTALDDGQFSLSFTGVLQQSSDLENWSDLDPAPVSPLVIAAEGERLFFRARPAGN